MATRTLPYAWYDDPAVLRVEQERIFARSWQYATRADAVTEPGSMTPAWAGSLPVLVVRAHDGRLRGFVNVCRHRGHVQRLDQRIADVFVQRTAPRHGRQNLPDLAARDDLHQIGIGQKR